MARYRTDFARPQPSIRPRGALAGLAVLCLGLLASGLTIERYQTLAEEIESLEKRVTRARHLGAPARQLSAVDIKALADEVRRVNQAAGELTFPWEPMFAAVESAMDKRIALLDFRPNLQKREIRIVGEADDFTALQAYMTRLAGGQGFADLRLLSHELLSRPNANASIKFELNAAWRGRT